MKRAIRTQKIEEALDKIGVPRHCLKITNVPSKTVATVIVGSKVFEVEASAGVTERELEFRLGPLVRAWEQHRDGQRDIVEDTARETAPAE